MKVIGILVIVLGIVSSILFFIAGSKLEDSGEDLTRLRSVGGESVAEAYYQEVGEYGIAYSRVAYAFGLGVFAISLGLGGALIIGGILINSSLVIREEE